MSTNTLTIVNRLDVPEIAGYTVAGGIVAYAVRAPGAQRWRGYAFAGDLEAVTPGLYADAHVATMHARKRLYRLYDTTPPAA